jgi:hypothetical protein
MDNWRKFAGAKRRPGSVVRSGMGGCPPGHQAVAVMPLYILPADDLHDIGRFRGTSTTKLLLIPAVKPETQRP